MNGFTISLRVLPGSKINNDGTADIHVQAHEMSPEERKVINTLFPNTYLVVERALATEALIGAQITE